MKTKKFSSKFVDIYFEKQCPYTRRRPFNLKALGLTGAALFLLFVGLTLWFGDGPESKSHIDTNHPSDIKTNPSQTHLSLPPSDLPPDVHGFFPSGSMTGLTARTDRSSDRIGSGSRSFAANQVIRRGEGGNDPLTRLPIGSTIPAKLINSILSSNSATPVIAQIPNEVLAHNTPSIPAGTQAIGQATYDDSTQRIRVQFNTLVYPEGDQHMIQGMAMELDGSAGLAGDYHSERGKRELGNFLGNFVAGFANGMEDRAATGIGFPYEIGSVRNGVLNGVSLSAQNEAKDFSDDLAKSKPYMTLSGGRPFVIYLEREYLP